VVINVENVPPILILVNLVSVTELKLHIVSVHQELMMMVSMPTVHHVLINAENVTSMDVLNVVETEFPQMVTVFAKEDSMKTEYVNVQPVIINVKLVQPMNIVNIVPPIEFKLMLQVVHVQSVLMKPELLNVQFVLINVVLVVISLPVLFVLNIELTSHLVTVKMDTMKVPKSVENVLINVELVKVHRITVSSVLKEEFTNLLVTAQPVNTMMVLTILLVMIVLHNVLLVQEDLIIVSNVLETELTQMFAHVKPNI
jgi:hypothetical protein